MASPEALRVATTAETWATRPSQMLGLVDDVTAFAVDEALAMRLQVERLRLANEKRRGEPPPGEVWADRGRLRAAA